jgi:lipopolysaccharide transport system permease protein
MSQTNRATRYASDDTGKSPIFHLSNLINELPAAHELGLRLFKRNMKAAYRQSALGFAWALIPPFINAILWIFLQKNGVMQISSDGSSYPLFVITGTLLWQIVSESVWAPINALNGNRNIISKINIPREGLLLSAIYELVFNMIIKALIIIIILIAFNSNISILGLIGASVGALGLVLVGFSLGLLLTPISLLYGDVQRGVGVILPFIMYISPVVYSAPTSGRMANLMQFNPLNTLIPFTRNLLLHLPTGPTFWFWFVILLFILIFIFCLIYFRISMPMVIERIGN